jgi:hypothetical protein
MSDELKDFRYYADKAEALLEGMTDLAEDDNEGATIITAMAAVFAELAKAAPKAEPKTPYSCSNNWHRNNGVTYVCELRYNHDGMHYNSAAMLEWDWHEGTSVTDAREDNN